MDGIIAFTAQWLLIVPALIVVATIVRRRQWMPDLIEAALSGALTILLVKLAGAAIHERRPFVAQGLRPLVMHAPDNAFPSDHLAACGLAVVYLAPRSKPLAVVVFCIAVLIAAARVAARLHWPVDVAAGFALGALASGIVLLVKHALARSSQRSS
jgi:undecaprenyl-diphosphatase